MELFIENAYEAKALFDAILAAKFSSGPKEDPVIMPSSLLATVAWRLRELIKEADPYKLGSMQEKGWLEWDNLTPERREWQVALNEATVIFARHWNKWGPEFRLKACQDLLSPLRPPENAMTLFMQELSEKINLSLSTSEEQATKL